MKRYIDAEKLKAEIERRKEEYKEDRYMSDYKGQIAYYKDEIYDYLLRFIASLQQEQPCDTCTNDKGCVTCKDGELWEGKEQPTDDLEDLNAEIEMEWGSFNKHLAEYDGESEKVVWLNKYSFEDIARHFYELGKNSK